MTNVLHTITNDRRLWVEEQKMKFPLDTFANKVEISSISLIEAIKKDQLGYILEFKKASPSKGLIRSDFNIKKIAESYEPYASAFSVLAEEKYFLGSYENIKKVRGLTSKPILCKDFMIDVYQVYLARYMGANAILLMLSILSDDQYLELAKVAEELGMEILTEVENADEMIRANKFKAKLIGVNNRDLHDLSVDIEKTIRLSPLAHEDALLISESGICSKKDTQKLSPYVSGFLVGSSLMKKDDIIKATKQLIFGKVKVCGLTQIEDAYLAAQLGASYGGLIFVEHSKRKVDLDQAKRITTKVEHLQYIGVFKDQPLEMVVNITRELNLSGIQLHGEESEIYINQLREQLKDCLPLEIWKAYGVVDTLPEFSDSNADIILLDTQKNGQSGGTGLAFSWELLKNRDLSRVVIAGGIGEDNVKELMELNLFAVDINSKVESSPGIKDPDKLRNIFQQIRIH